MPPHNPDARIAELEARVAELEAIINGQRVDDSFYALLESRYRGDRETVMQMMRPYVSAITNLIDSQENTTREQFLVLDLGCGRGELLEALGKAGVSAIGVDSNPKQLRAAKDRNLRVEETDLFEALKSRNAGSTDVITAIHVIEHIDFQAKKRLLGETFRVLRPGGLMILETPNPENLRVGAWKFHIDPTHLTPVPPELALLLAENAGFINLRIARLREDPNLPHRRRASGIDAETALLLYGPQDYAVLAEKPV